VTDHEPARRIALAATLGEGGPFEHRQLRLAALDAGSVDRVTEIAVTGQAFALVVPYAEPPVPEPGKATRLMFTVTTAVCRETPAETRDDTFRTFAALGIRLSWQNLLEAHLSDVGVPTLGDVVTGGAPEPDEPDYPGRFRR
jgi:hypothetical protein